jgi:hypothetical protein
MRIARLAAAMVAAVVLALASAATATALAAHPNASANSAVVTGPSEGPSEEPSEEPTDEPEIPDFDAAFTPDSFQPGDTLRLHTTGCPDKPIVQDIDGLFASPLGLEQVGDFDHEGSAATKSNLPDGKTFRVLVACKDRGAFLFTFSQGKKTQKQHKSGQTGVTPVGGVDTGDGSSLTSGGSAVLPIVVGGSAVVLAGAFGLVYRRRKAEDA